MIADVAVTRASRQPWLRLNHVWLALPPLLVALKVLLTPIAPHDFWWHLAYGRQIVVTGAIPTVDTFSYTRGGAAFFDQPWLAQVLMYLLYTGVGAAGLQVVQACLVAGAYLLLERLCELGGAGRRTAVIATVLAAIAAYDNWHIRPQTLVLPLWVAAIGVMERWRRHGRTPWLLLPMVALWSNLHGTWTLPLALGAIYGACEGFRTFRGAGQRSQTELQSLGGSLALAALASLANPHGWGVWRYTASLLGNQAIGSLVTEWAPPRLGTASGNLFFGLLALVLVALYIKRRHTTITHVLALAAFGALALDAGRNAIWFAALAAALLAPLWVESSRKRRVEATTLNSLLLLLLTLPVVLALPPFKRGLGLPSRLAAVVDPQTPVAAVAALQTLPERPQRLFHDSGFGSYLMWAAPDQQVFVDPRIEHYPIEQWHDYIRLSAGLDVERLTARYGIDAFLLSPDTQAELITTLRRDRNWRETVNTDAAVLFQPVAHPD